MTQAQIKPFEINVPEATLTDLQERLKRTRWTDSVEGAGWGMGTNADYIKALVQYWQTDYDWRKHEAALNTFARALPLFRP